MVTHNDFPALYAALAQGHSIQTRHFTEDESDWTDQWNWTPGAMAAFLNKGDGWVFRVMPRTIQINGIEVPEPLRHVDGMAPITQFWSPTMHRPDVKALRVGFSDTGFDLFLKRGLLHATEEAAIKHAEALLVCSAS